ncbi:MAG TPA: type III pantothenate kinase [Methylotenera sp.]|nr:type III pantothenate kinase [Methylotenera sp.]
MNTADNTILAIDAGNTRVKWGLFDALGGLMEYGACLHSELTNTILPQTSRVIISNVAGKSIEATLKKTLPNSTIRWVSAGLEACGVENRYETPAKLGSDRWAAVIAAWHIKHAPCVVVNAGTAVTVDALSIHPENNSGIFLGGMILPGLNLMQQSLGIATAQLPEKTADSHTDINQHIHHPMNIFATNTVDAIYAGALHAILGAINLMALELHRHSNTTPHIIISGGNAAIIHQQLIQHHLMDNVTNSAIIVDNLVLQGLYLLDNFMHQQFTQSEAL